jgi:protein-S-isoprenylcysteine O-methyltransferase Ste14
VGDLVMSLVPVFELGLWNAWILVLFMFLVISGLSPLVIRLVYGSVKSKESSKRHSARPKLNKREKQLDRLSTLILLALFGYSVFLPLNLGTYMFYIGLIIYAISIIFGFTAMIDFARTPMDKPASKGTYAISRNPMYFSMFLIFISISLACTSWLYLLLTIIWLIITDIGIVTEERLCLETYGDSYKKYVERTPRWIGIPKHNEK